MTDNARSNVRMRARTPAHSYTPPARVRSTHAPARAHPHQQRARVTKGVAACGACRFGRGAGSVKPFKALAKALRKPFRSCGRSRRRISLARRVDREMNVSLRLITHGAHRVNISIPLRPVGTLGPRADSIPLSFHFLTHFK